MKDVHEIDNLFRDAINSAEFAPSDNVWHSMEEKLQQKDGRVKENTIKNLRLTLMAISAFFLAFVAWHYFSPDQKIKLSEQRNPNLSANSSNTSQDRSIESNTGKTNAQIENQNQSSANLPAANATDKESEVASSSNKNAQSTVHDQASDAHTEINKFVDNTEPKKQPSQNVPFTSFTEKESKAHSIAKNILLYPYFIADYAQKTNVPTTQEKENGNVQQDLNKKKETEVAFINPENQDNIIFVPNAFTPNGDGLNDVFLPKSSEEPKEYKFTIFDNRGAIVFFSDDFNKGWDGKSQINGIEVIKEEMYMWRMEIKNSKGEKEHLMGYFTLLK